MKQILLNTLTAVLGISAASLHGGEIDLGRPVPNTPYDQYNGPVRQVFARFGSSSVSVEEARSYLRTARRFRYYFDTSNPYKPQLPEITELKRQGDCKAKSLWLAQKMGDSGSRYTIGRASAGARMSHAWLLWHKSGTWYVLDPTMESDVLFAEKIAGRKLFPQYSYNRSGSFIHPTYSEYVK